MYPVRKNHVLVRKNILWNDHKVFMKVDPLQSSFERRVELQFARKISLQREKIFMNKFFSQRIVWKIGEEWGCNSVAHSIYWIHHSIFITSLAVTQPSWY